MYSFGYNSFWNFGSVAVQELLTKSDLQLDELLEEEGLILEVKSQNQNLYEFLLKEENFKELISCAITIPDAELHQNNQKKLYKYPFTCADILSSDSQPIVSEFFKSKKEIQESTHKSEVITDDDEDDEVNVDSEKLEKPQDPEDKTKEEEKDIAFANEFPYLDYLFAFLESESLNLTSAGYFAKIVNNLLNKRPAEFISYIYERKPELLQKMIKHIYSKSIAEFLAKLLTFETSVLANANNEVYNERRSEVLKEIIKKLQPEFDLEEINNTAYLICEVFSKYNSMHNSHEILNNLLEKSVIDYFFKILKTGKSTSACAVALILGNIFAYYILINTPKVQESNLDDPFGESQSPSNITQHQVLELTEEIPLLKAFVENLEQVIQFIGSSCDETIPGQHGAQAVPFGSARLKVLELIIIAMKANNNNIYNKLIEYNFFETLKNILVKHDWNNLLHNQVEKIFTHIIESGTDDLKIALFEKAKILDFIVDNSKDSEFTLSGKHARKVRKGYLGHLVRLSNKIAENRDPILQKYIEENVKWKEYVESLLAETNQRDRTNFGGKDPRAPSPEPSYIHERDQYRDEDEKREEDDEDEMEIEEVENMEEEERDHHPVISTSDEFIQETEQHVLQATSPKNEEEERIKQASVPIRGRNSFDPLNRFIPDYDEEIKEENENIWVLEPADLKTVEETLDAKFYPNHYWKKAELYSAEDILKELEGL